MVVLVLCVLFSLGLFGSKDRLVVADDLLCTVAQLSGGRVSVDPRCLMFAPEGVEQEFEQTVDMMRDRIVGFSDEYGLYKKSFVYSGAVPLFSGALGEFVQDRNVMNPQLESSVTARSGSVTLSAEEYAVWRLMSYSYYVTRREKLDQL